MINIFYCLYCNNEVTRKWSTTNTFCNNVCSGAYQREQSNKRVERGELTSNSINVAKRYLIEKHGEECDQCHIGNKWYGKPLTLQLDHIDGNSENMAIENLRLLCPNCHSQTINYGNKNRRVDGKRKEYYTRFRANN